MKKIVFPILLLLLTVIAPGWADYEQCKNVMYQWEYSRNEAYDSANSLVKCLSTAEWYEDCDSKFRRVKNDYQDYETNQNNAETWCNEFRY